MWYSYKQSIEIFWQEKADSLFDSAWISKEKNKPWGKSKPIEKLNSAEYIKLSEYWHWKLLHKRLKSKWIKHTHIWNEAGQSWSKNIIIMMAKKKAQWVSKWYPDYHIILDMKWYKISLHLELKKARGVKWGLNWSTISEEQIDWIEELWWIPFSHWAIVHWSDEAIKYVDSIINIYECLDMDIAFIKWKTYE
jgi:hypothetical protein